MKEVKRRKKKDRVAATLMLCFCVIALTSIFTIKSNINKITKSAGDVAVSEKTSTDNTDKTNQTDTTQDTETDDTEEASAKAPIVDSQDSVTQTVNFICPLIGGTPSKEYSMDMVIYSLTLDQFMTHPGTDIRSEQSNKVVASAAGTVTGVYADDCYGMTVEITHSNGLISRYCNLDKTALVEKGDTVAQGQSIGTVGTSALYEGSEDPHLHLEFIHKGKVVDPAKYVSF